MVRNSRQATYVVGEVGIHDDDEVTRAEIQPMNICRPASRSAVAKEP